MKDKLFTISLTVIIVVCAGVIGLVAFNKFFGEASFGNLDCVSRSQIMTTQDQHMKGAIDQSQQFTVLYDFYKCNKVDRENIAWFRFSQSIPPVPRWVKGVPGDAFSLTQDEKERDKWWLSINGEKVKVNGEEYYVQSQTAPPLKVYENSLKGKLPEKKYILLSHMPPGLTDSSNLGVIEESNLIGRVKLK